MARTIKTQDSVAELIKSYPGKWVTVSFDKKRVVGVSSRMETALKQAHQKGESRPLLVKAPDSYTASFIY
jgi:hypothetical protein